MRSRRAKVQEKRDRNWILPMVRGVTAIAIGLATMVWPEVTLRVFTVAFAVFALIEAAVALYGALTGGSQEPRWAQYAHVAVSVAAGLIALLWPGITSIAAVWLVAGWALARGLIDVVVAIRGRTRLARTWPLITAGLLSVALAVAYFLFPQAGVLALLWMLAIYAVLFGVVQISRSLTLRSVLRQERSARS